MTADFYIKTTKDWLVEAPILATAGTGAPFINGGDVKNTGVELALTWNDRAGKDFNYNIGVNGAYNKNKVGNIPTEDGIIHGKSICCMIIHRSSTGHKTVMLSVTLGIRNCRYLPEQRTDCQLECRRKAWHPAGRRTSG